MQALPPRHVYSAIVKNAGVADIKVVGAYTMPDATTEVEEITIAPGADGILPQKTQESGTIVVTGYLAEVKVSAGGNESSVAHPFKVDSPTHDYLFTVGEDLSIHH